MSWLDTGVLFKQTFYFCIHVGGLVTYDGIHQLLRLDVQKRGFFFKVNSYSFVVGIGNILFFFQECAAKPSGTTRNPAVPVAFSPNVACSSSSIGRTTVSLGWSVAFLLSLSISPGSASGALSRALKAGCRPAHSPYSSASRKTRLRLEEQEKEPVLS